MTYTRHASGKKAFSLVEVTLAVALTATVAMTLLGLLPVGIEGMRESAVTAAHARILQSVAADCQMVDWAQLTSAEYESKTYVFDSQGVELVSSQLDEAVFLARIEVEEARALPGASEPNSRMRLVLVRIIEGNLPSLFGTAREKRYPTQIAQMDDSP